MENSLNADIYAQIKELTGDNWAGLVCFLLHEKFLNKDSFWKTLMGTSNFHLFFFQIFYPIHSPILTFGQKNR
jgi:hypothetical protein